MKTLLVSALALAFLTAPSSAAVLSDVDHADVPNCTILGPNLPTCELLTMQAIFPPNGIQYVGESCNTVPYTNGKGEAKTRQVCQKQL